VAVNVILHASPGLKEVFSSTQQQRGPLANIGAMMDEIYNLLRCVKYFHHSLILDNYMSVKFLRNNLVLNYLITVRGA
jgi:hypothetical protein